MFHDGKKVTPGSVISSDLCVIGAGAAGITIAGEFANQKWKVCVLEGGGESSSAQAQDLYRGKNVGRPYLFPEGIEDPELNKSRDRMPGGTTEQWYGMCRPFDALDFEKRENIPHSGWPIKREDLETYYSRANQICEVIDPTYEYKPKNEKKKFLHFDPAKIKTKRYSFSRPTRFGSRYRSDLE